MAEESKGERDHVGSTNDRETKPGQKHCVVLCTLHGLDGPRFLNIRSRPSHPLYHVCGCCCCCIPTPPSPAGRVRAQSSGQSCAGHCLLLLLLLALAGGRHGAISKNLLYSGERESSDGDGASSDPLRFASPRIFSLPTRIAIARARAKFRGPLAKPLATTGRGLSPATTSLAITLSR